MIRWRDWLRGLFMRGPAPPAPDPGVGFGQSLADDLRFQRRFRRYRRQPAVFRGPTGAEAQAHDAHPVIGRFGDGTVAVSEQGGEIWLVRDRLWHGWPDPPEFAVFALQGDTIVSAVDFSSWPKCWVRED